MEKVQFQLEATLPELKDLHEKGLFTKHEINQITRRRTALETSLIRQVTRKDDFFKYAEYEISLERLRKVRWKKLKYHINPPPPSASTYSIPRRVMYILKRATLKFPSDIAVWLAYIEYANREGMRKVVTQTLNHALQHHPLSPTLYLLTCYQHLHPNAPFPRESIPSSSTLNLPQSTEPSSSFSLQGTSPARTTLLLGIRAIPDSQELWTEYIKLELGWVEALRRRWATLGIEASSKGKNAEVPLSLDGGEGSFGPDGEDARKAILDGQLVIQAVQSALDAIKFENTSGMEFRKSLITMLRTYPSPLRSKALDVVYDDLSKHNAEGNDHAAEARLMLITRKLYEKPYEAGQTALDNVDLGDMDTIEILGKIGGDIRKQAKSSGSAFLQHAAMWLVETYRNETCSDEIREYLFSIMSSLTNAKLHPPPSVLLLHMDLARDRLDSAEYHKIVTKHSSICPSDPRVQLEYLKCQMDQVTDAAQSNKVFETVTKATTHPGLSTEDGDAARQIWSLWINFTNRQPNASHLQKTLLRLSKKAEGIEDLHSTMLSKVLAQAVAGSSPSKAVAEFRRLVSGYGPPTSFYSVAFEEIASNPKASVTDMKPVYEAWRGACRSSQDKIESCIVWAGWLMEHGSAHDARTAVETTRQLLPQTDIVKLDTEWQRLLDGDVAVRDRVHVEDEVMTESSDDDPMSD